MEIGELIHTIVQWGLPLVLAITLHEAAHAFAANSLGDPTGRLQGRMSADPLKHVDPFGTVILPLLLVMGQAPFVFGYAKPVPVDMRYFRSPRRDMAMVALAGPGANIAQALIAAVALHFVLGSDGQEATWARGILQAAILVNCLLAVFNMLPLPPLDGSRLVLWALPRALVPGFMKFERFGMVILLALMILPGLLQLPVNPLGFVMGPVVQTVINFIVVLAGHG